jgi:hypothetical protein
VDNGGVIDLTSPRLDGFSWLSAEESEVDLLRCRGRTN